MVGFDNHPRRWDQSRLDRGGRCPIEREGFCGGSVSDGRDGNDNNWRRKVESTHIPVNRLIESSLGRVDKEGFNFHSQTSQILQ